jgi:hypothetical protein
VTDLPCNLQFNKKKLKNNKNKKESGDIRTEIIIFVFD